MSTKPDSQAPQESPPVAGSTGIGRRRLLRAGLSAAPVMLAVSGRSAMAVGSCDSGKGLSPLAWASMKPDGYMCASNMSHTVGRNTLGKAPSYWRPVTVEANYAGVDVFAFPGSLLWPSTQVKPFPDYDASNSTQWKNMAVNDPRWANGTKFSHVFGGFESRSFSQILIASKNRGPSHADTLLSYFCAAYLNALVIQNYSMTAEEVVKAYGVDPELPIQNLRGFFRQTWE